MTTRKLAATLLGRVKGMDKPELPSSDPIAVELGRMNAIIRSATKNSTGKTTSFSANVQTLLRLDLEKRLAIHAVIRMVTAYASDLSSEFPIDELHQYVLLPTLHHCLI